MITEVCRMIAGVREKDFDKAMSYAKLLAENLDKDGKTKEAARVRRAINGEIGPLACMDEQSISLIAATPAFIKTSDCMFCHHLNKESTALSCRKGHKIKPVVKCYDFKFRGDAA